MAVQAKSFDGDRDALYAAIISAHRAYVLATAQSIAGHSGLRSLAEDLTQTVLLRFFLKWKCGSFPDITWVNWCEPDQQRLLKAWFFVAALRVGQEFYRRHCRNPGIEFDESRDDHHRVSSEFAPIQKLMIEEARQCCTPTQLKIVDLDREGFTSDQIAEKLGMMPSTVRGHLLRARRNMLAYLESGAGPVLKSR